jgi:hypothetical protein
MLLDEYFGSVKLWKVAEKFAKYDFMGSLEIHGSRFGLFLWILLEWRIGILCEYYPYMMVAAWNINAIEMELQFAWSKIWMM